MVVDDSRNLHVHVVPSALDCFYSCGCPTDGEWFTPGTLLKMTPEPESFERKDKMTHAFIWKISLSARRTAHKNTTMLSRSRGQWTNISAVVFVELFRTNPLRPYSLREGKFTLSWDQIKKQYQHLALGKILCSLSILSFTPSLPLLWCFNIWRTECMCACMDTLDYPTCVFVWVNGSIS